MNRIPPPQPPAQPPAAATGQRRSRDRLHYGRLWLCRAAQMHGKGLYTHGKAFAVRRRTAKAARRSLARQRVLCRAPPPKRTAKPLPCGVCFAVCYHSLPCEGRCRAPPPSAVRGALPCALPPHARQRIPLCRAPSHPHARQRHLFAVRPRPPRMAKNTPGTPQASR